MKVYIIQWIDCRVNISWGVVIDRCRQDLRVKRLFSIVTHNEIKPFIGQVMSSLSLIIQQVHFDFLFSHNFVIDFPLQESINMSVWRQFDQICRFFLTILICYHLHVGTVMEMRPVGKNRQLVNE